MFIVEQEFVYGWENVWHDAQTGMPTVYETKEQAEAELKDFIEDTIADYQQGNLEEPYSYDEFRIVEVVCE